MKIEFSSEFMKNHKHAVVMSPDAQFEVLQTQQGLALCFSIGTDGVFYCTREAPGSVGGWAKADLSGALSAQCGGAKVAAKAFDVSQSLAAGTVDVALAFTAGNVDRLAVALNVPNQTDAWAAPPQWQILAYDDAAHPQPQLAIADVYVAQSGSTEYIVADILANPSSPVKAIARYFIDPGKTITGKAWNPHPLAFDLEAGGVVSALGRKANQLMDGIYTLGAIVGEPELVYTPLYNAFKPSLPPLPTRIKLPAGATADATCMALSVNADGTTDLFVAAAGSLYFLAADAQVDGATPTSIFKHDLLKGVQSLHVNNAGNEVLVWGLNNQGQVFYLRNTLGSELAAPWTTPVPIVSGAVQVNSYRNYLTHNSVIFAQTSDASGSVLIQLTEDPVTSAWQQRSILLPATDVRDVVETSTYTTHVQVCQENKIPAPGQAVAITGSSPCTVTINNRYYRLSDSSPVSVTSDATGNITILQDVTGIGAVMYKLQIDTLVVNVNPMQTVVDKLSKVSGGGDLDVTVTNERGEQQPLVGPGVTAQQKNDTAKAVNQFVQIQKTMPQDGSVKPSTGARAARAAFRPLRDRIFGINYANGGVRYFEGLDQAATHGIVFADGRLSLAATAAAPTIALDDAITVAAGDLFRWIDNALDDIENFFVTVAEGVANFFIKIAGQLYHFVMECVNAVMQAIQFVLAMIAIALLMLVMWLGFLFGWKDIVRTHRVLKNLLMRFSQHAIDSIGESKAGLQQAFATLEQQIDSWADLPPSSASIGSITGASQGRPGQGSPQAHWGTYHLKNNAAGSSSAYSPTYPGGDQVDQLLQDLVATLEKEGDILLGAVERLKTEVVDKIADLSLTDIVKKLVAIVLDTLLETAENVLLAVLDVIEVLVKGVMDVLAATIDVPILSWMYKEVTGDELSVLDAVCLVAAVPMTIIYKLDKGGPIFPDDDFTAALIAAPDFATIQRLYAPSPVVPRPVPARARVLEAVGAEEAAPGRMTVAVGAPARMVETAAEGGVNPHDLEPLVYGCNIAGFIGSILLTICNGLKYNSPNNPTVFFLAGICYLPYVAPSLPSMVKGKDTKWHDALNTQITCISVVKTMADIGLYQLTSKTPPQSKLGRWSRISPAAECLINAVWEVPTVGAYCDSKQTLPDALNMLANTSFNLGGVIAPGAAYPQDPDTKFAFTVAMGALAVVYGSLLLAQDV